MAAQNQAAQVNSSPVSFIRHLGFQFYLEISFPLSFKYNAERPIRQRNANTRMAL
jgi:hypothetical protein